MIICGVKITHDAAVAVIENGKLLFSIEMEKINNGKRYAKMPSMNSIHDVLSSNGLPDMELHIDGWNNGIAKTADGSSFQVAPYHEHDGEFADPIQRECGYSYRHVTGHIAAAYATAPFVNEPAYVIVYDGGTQPRLYYLDPSNKTSPISYESDLFYMYGSIYHVMGYYFGPYKQKDVMDYDGIEWAKIMAKYPGKDFPGKLMSWIAFGKPSEYLIAIMDKICSHEPELTRISHWVTEHKFMRLLSKFVLSTDTDADVLASIHTWLERKLVTTAIDLIPEGSNLCYAGGCALNIKWNSALRDSGHFKNVWVPPFPNDCGNAIGVAVCEMWTRSGNWKLDWDVYSGPMIQVGNVLDGWSSHECTPEEVAYTIYCGHPVVCLIGKAELGPRALGHRSILCSAVQVGNKDLVNKVKLRESFRPVAPICMEEYACDIFEPGVPDPYMLFDHKVKKEWIDKVPEIVHMDGTARLQTVNNKQCPVVYSILSEYYALTGIPLLCNTSANFNGSGFFPSVESAMVWGKIDHIWSDGIMYTRCNLS
jgi:carbamoyltransferase